MPSIIDLHAHPSMKTYFGKKRLTRRGHSSPGFAPLGLRTSYPALEAGGVGVLGSSVYVPERRLVRDCWFLRTLSWVMPRLRKALRADPALVAHTMLDHVEAEVARVNREAGGGDVLIVARSNAELEAAEAGGQMAFLHTLEGAHALAGDVANVRAFQRRGVCSITLAHFYPNGVAPPVDAVPSDMILRRVGCFRYDEDLDAPLTPLGKAVVEEMLDAGVIVDLTHCTPRARREAYALPNPRHRPLVMSHTGLAALRDHPLNASDEDIRAIADSGGVIGIIFYNHWLREGRGRDTLQHVVRHALRLADVGGDECVAFGSDFDGMTDPPDDLRDPSAWPRLARALEEAGVVKSRLERFLYSNARRVLRDGWI